MESNNPFVESKTHSYGKNKSPNCLSFITPGFDMTDWLRAKLQRKLQHTTALIKIDRKFTKVWRLRKHCLNVLSHLFANEETEIHKGRKISARHYPVSNQNLELSNPRGLHCLFFDKQDDVTFKCPCA